LEEPVGVGNRRELVPGSRRSGNEGVLLDLDNASNLHTVDSVDHTSGRRNRNGVAHLSRSGGDHLIDVVTGEHLEDLGRQRQTGVRTNRTVESLLERRQTSLRHLGGVDGERGRGLELLTGVDRGGADLPAEGDRLGRVVDGVVRLLRRSREGAVDQMQLVPVVRTIDIVTDTSTVRKTEGLTSLLTHRDTGDRRGRTIARGERVRISEGLDGTVELLGRDQVQVLDVVRVLRVRLRTGRRLGDGRKTVPSVSGVVDTLRVGQVEDA